MYFWVGAGSVFGADEMPMPNRKLFNNVYIKSQIKYFIFDIIGVCNVITFDSPKMPIHITMCFCL